MLWTNTSAGRDQLRSAALPPSRLEVEHDGALVAVEVGEDGAEARRRERRHGAHAVALGRLDLDDLGAEVAQDLRAVGAEDDRGQVEDAQAFEQGDHAGPPGEDRAGERRPAVARAIPDRLQSGRAGAPRSAHR